MWRYWIDIPQLQGGLLKELQPDVSFAGPILMYTLSSM